METKNNRLYWVLVLVLPAIFLSGCASPVKKPEYSSLAAQKVVQKSESGSCDLIFQKDQDDVAIYTSNLRDVKALRGAMLPVMGFDTDFRPKALDVTSYAYKELSRVLNLIPMEDAMTLHAELQKAQMEWVWESELSNYYVFKQINDSFKNLFEKYKIDYIISIYDVVSYHRLIKLKNLAYVTKYSGEAKDKLMIMTIIANDSFLVDFDEYKKKYPLSFATFGTQDMKNSLQFYLLSESQYSNRIFESRCILQYFDYITFAPVNLWYRHDIIFANLGYEKDYYNIMQKSSKTTSGKQYYIDNIKKYLGIDAKAKFSNFVNAIFGGIGTIFGNPDEPPERYRFETEKYQDKMQKINAEIESSSERIVNVIVKALEKQ